MTALKPKRLMLENSNNKLYGRSSQMAILKGAYTRVEDGAAEVLFIEGPSGVGKTALVEAVMKKEQCIFAKGKFIDCSSCATGDSPFAAIIGALTTLVDEICDEEDLREEMAEAMEDDMSMGELDALAKFIPEFQEIFDDDELFYDRNHGHDDDSSDDDENGLESDEESGDTIGSNWSDRKDNLTKTMLAIRDFMRILTSQSEFPIVLFLDDLQWADGATLELIECLANDDLQQYFLFIATIRPNEIQKDHPVNTWKCQYDDPTKRESMNYLTQLTLKGLNIIEINGMLSEVMNLDEGTTFPLSTLVMTRTNGNVFFVIQLLEHLQNEELLLYDFSSFRWTWNLDKVRGTALSDHVVDLVASRIQRHPEHIQRTLQLAACVGFKVDPKVLEAVKTALPGDAPLDIATNLEFCVEERLMERLSDGRLKFFHDRIHQATLSLLPDADEFSKVHLRIGVLLWGHINALNKSNEKVDDKFLFLCAEQMSMGSEHLKDKGMKLRLAQLHSLVGKKATDLSAFGTAAEYFEKGLELLVEVGNKWSDTTRQLCMTMYTSYAEVQYYVGNFEDSMEAILEVLNNNPNVNARTRVTMIRLHILKAECRLKDFVALSLVFLDELGESLPKDPSGYQSKIEHQKMMKKLHGLSDQDILNLPPTKSIILKVFNSMMIPLETLGMRHLSSIIICRAIKFTLKYGITEQSPECFALLGVHLIAEKEELAMGYRFGELALKMAKKIEPKDLNAQVVHWVYICTKPWQLVPMSQCVDRMFEGHVAAMKQGDPFAAFMAINAYFSLCFYSSLDLRPLLRDIEEFSSQMLEYGQKLIFLQILPIWQCILNLMGSSMDPLDMDRGDALDRQYELNNENRVGQQACWSFLMQIAMCMGNLEVASDMSARLQSHKLGIMKAHMLYPARIFFFGLVAIANFRKSGGKRKHKMEAAKHILTMRHWVQKQAANLVHKLLILEAEFESMDGSKSGDALQAKYDLAISTARKSGFIQDAALAAQLAGTTLLGIPDMVHFADSYIRKSFLLYKTWGANAVADRVKKNYPDVFSKDKALTAGDRGNFLSRERFDRRVSLDHQRRLSEDSN